MRVDRNHLAVMSHAFQGLGTQIARAEQRGQRLAVALANGVDPVIAYASQEAGPLPFPFVRADAPAWVRVASVRRWPAIAALLSLALIPVVARADSGVDPHASSPAGA